MLCFHDSRDQRGKHIVSKNRMVYVAFYKTKLYLVKQKLFFKQECCYDMYANVDQLGPLRRSVPLAGTVLQYNPFFQRYQYTNYDFNPRKLCCSSGHCNWYYEVRPIPRCYRRSPFQPGKANLCSSHEYLKKTIKYYLIKKCVGKSCCSAR